ncbi:REP element-mobilizing transposase RayT [Desulfuromusa kysingii]|uniref:REP element-mobilizing transposase RayT n=1 Tax=Desulfuromusa kysingii TaxID=37625 RepID=A0A1H4CMM9_9BACT|nr:transposase [Desulfuromusa kysingii]SEA61292.1 REP element-mobilizing transposase RayT [Desulfuromusa kysingii]
MNFNPEIHERRSIRMVDYDYSSAGFYFVTICVQGRESLLGEIADGVITLNDAGRMVENSWLELPAKYPDMAIDEHVIMPNHFHGIIILQPPVVVGAPLAAPGYGKNGTTDQGAASSAPTLGDVIRAFKSISAINVNISLDRSGQPLWQRNYYERIIRNENELHNIRQYIRNNPAQWDDDNENPTNQRNSAP